MAKEQSPAPVLARRCTKETMPSDPPGQPQRSRSLFIHDAARLHQGPKAPRLRFLPLRPPVQTGIEGPGRLPRPQPPPSNWPRDASRPGPASPFYSVLENADLYHVVDSYAIGPPTPSTASSSAPRAAHRPPQGSACSILPRAPLEITSPASAPPFYRVRPQGPLVPHQPAEGQVTDRRPRHCLPPGASRRALSRPRPVLARAHRPALRLRRLGHPSRRTRCQGPRQAAARRRLPLAVAAGNEIAKNRFELHQPPLKSLLPRRQAANWLSSRVYAADLVEIPPLGMPRWKAPELSYI